MIYVAAFNMSQYKGTLNRVSKPFNPILGETYELVRPEFKFLSEQVSHHPPVSACHAMGKDNEWEYSMHTNLKTQFWGSSMEVLHMAPSYVKLAPHQETYIIYKPNSLVHNLIFGTMYIEHLGKMKISKFGADGEETCFELEFKKQGWSKKNWAVIEGKVPVREGSDFNWIINGKWTE